MTREKEIYKVTMIGSVGNMLLVTCQQEQEMTH